MTDYLVESEHGEPLGLFDPEHISDEGCRFAFALAAVAGDETATRHVEQETLTRVGSSAFGYVAASALHYLAGEILAPCFDYARATGTDLQAGMRAIRDGEQPACAICGEELFLVEPGRTICERCRITGHPAA